MQIIPRQAAFYIDEMESLFILAYQKAIICVIVLIIETVQVTLRSF